MTAPTSSTAALRPQPTTPPNVARQAGRHALAHRPPGQQAQGALARPAHQQRQTERQQFALPPQQQQVVFRGILVPATGGRPVYEARGGRCPSRDQPGAMYGVRLGRGGSCCAARLRGCGFVLFGGCRLHTIRVPTARGPMLARIDPVGEAL